MSVLLKVLETLRIIAGVGAPICLIWGVLSGVDWSRVEQLIALIISIIGSQAFGFAKFHIKSYLQSK